MFGLAGAGGKASDWNGYSAQRLMRTTLGEVVNIVKGAILPAIDRFQGPMINSLSIALGMLSAAKELMAGIGLGIDYSGDILMLDMGTDAEILDRNEKEMASIGTDPIKLNPWEQERTTSTPPSNTITAWKGIDIVIQPTPKSLTRIDKSTETTLPIPSFSERRKDEEVDCQKSQVGSDCFTYASTACTMSEKRQIGQGKMIEVAGVVGKVKVETMRVDKYRVETDHAAEVNGEVVIRGHIPIVDEKGKDKYRVIISKGVDSANTVLVVFDMATRKKKFQFRGDFFDCKVMYAIGDKAKSMPVCILAAMPSIEPEKNEVCFMSVNVVEETFKKVLCSKHEYSSVKQFFKLFSQEGNDYFEIMFLLDRDKVMYSRLKRTTNWFDGLRTINCIVRSGSESIIDYNLDVVGPEQKSGNRLLCWIGNRKDSDQLTVGVEVIVKMDHNASIAYKYVKAFHFTVPKQLCIDRIHRENGSSIAVPKGYNLEPCQVILCSEMNVIVVVCLESFDSGAPQSSMQSKTNLAASTSQKKYSVAVLVFTTGRQKKLLNNQEVFEEEANKDSNQNISDYFEISNFLNPEFETKQEVFALCPVHAVSLRKKLSLSFEPKYCSEPAIRCITKLHNPFPSPTQSPLAHLQIDLHVRGTYGLSRLILSSSPVISSVSVHSVEYSLDVWSRCIDLSRDGGVMIGSERDKSGILAMEAVPYSSDNSTKYSIMYTPTKSAVVTLFDDN
jgi:hypothetical protein